MCRARRQGTAEEAGPRGGQESSSSHHEVSPLDRSRVVERASLPSVPARPAEPTTHTATPRASPSRPSVRSVGVRGAGRPSERLRTFSPCPADPRRPAVQDPGVLTRVNNPVGQYT
ncbi:hypothetical protein CU044_4202 [Streptomyces sp. L-9-10]|nr:hypothetical protein CU044_4202 [Streptomyces sp. L-9-10]